MKYSILNKFGSSYTLSSLDDEKFLNLIYMQICMEAEAKAMEFAERKSSAYSQMYVSKDNI